MQDHSRRAIIAKCKPRLCLRAKREASERIARDRQDAPATRKIYQDFAIAVMMCASESTSRVSITSAGECE
jgi:hypothetical protein